MIASLAMYARAETASATGRFWRLIRDNLRNAGIDAPDELEEATPFMETWRAPDLVLSQTCGRPYRLKLHNKTNLIGTPDYGLRDCPPGYYRSAIVVQARDRRVYPDAYHDALFAYNDEMSQSGWAAPQCHAGGLGFRFTNCWQSGSHVESARAVAEARADIAAIDALSWQLIKRYEPFSLELRVLDWTIPTPGLPLICGPDLPRAPLFRAVAEAIEALEIEDRQRLSLRGLVPIPKEAYLAVPNP